MWDRDVVAMLRLEVEATITEIMQQLGVPWRETVQRTMERLRADGRVTRYWGREHLIDRTIVPYNRGELGGREVTVTSNGCWVYRLRG